MNENICLIQGTPAESDRLHQYRCGQIKTSPLELRFDSKPSRVLENFRLGPSPE